MADASSTLLDRWDALGRPLSHLPRWAAALVLALLAAVMTWGAFVTAPVEHAERAKNPLATTTAAGKPGKGKGDLALYSRIADRVAKGEGYYAAAMDEQRHSRYPTKPFVAVRQPTLAWLQWLIGIGGVRYFEMGLVVACIVALQMRVATLVSMPERLAAISFLCLAALRCWCRSAG